MLSTDQQLGCVTTHVVKAPAALVSAQVAAPQIELQPKVWEALAALTEQAQQDGIALSVASGFRSFERQLGIWNRKYRGEQALYDSHGNQLDAQTLTPGEKIDAILTWSALPGASRHHFGTDLDVYDPRPFANPEQPRLQLLASEYSEGGPCFELAAWLKRHAHEFGFFLPYARYQGGIAAEPWHLSFRAEAEAVRANYSLEALAEAIAAAPMEGKQCVLARLEQIKERYLDNICTDSGWSDIWCGY